MQLLYESRRIIELFQILNVIKSETIASTDYKSFQYVFTIEVEFFSEIFVILFFCF